MNRDTPYFITGFFSGFFASVALLLLFYFLSNDFKTSERFFDIFTKPGLYGVEILNSLGLAITETSIVALILFSSVFYGLFFYIMIRIVGEN